MTIEVGINGFGCIGRIVFRAAVQNFKNDIDVLAICADLNVPQRESGRFTEVTRMRASVPCIQMALDAGAGVMKRARCRS